MKDLTTTPTAELLAEWGKLAAIAKHTNYARDTTFDKVEFEDKIAAIAAELDRRTADIRNVNGFPAFGDYRQIIYAKNDPKAREAVVNIPIDELIERMKWLQIKGGK